MILSTMLMYYQMMLEHSSYKKLHEDEEKVRRDPRIPRATLTVFCYSCFTYLYTSGNDQVYLNVTGHNHRSFDKLLEKFKLYYYFYTFNDNMGIIHHKKL